jgi:hypothetical protein
MSTLTWELNTAPAQTPEYWLLFVDGSAWCSLANQAPYMGAGQYSVDLTRLDSNVPIPPGAHAVGVALVGHNSIGPQSSSVAVNIPIPVAVAVTTTQIAAPVVWPAATEVSYE